MRHFAGFQLNYSRQRVLKKTYIPVLWLWMTALLLSTVGISVQQLYCYCLGETAVSVFLDAEDPCEKSVSEVPDACCSAMVPECCGKESLHAGSVPCCPQKSVKVFLLKSEFTLAQPWQKAFDCPLWADELPGFLRLYQPVICATAPAHTINTNLPPPLSGRQICLRHERLLC
ncbi:MAG: hypothetical protein R3D58_13820 [Saprospiraceae bacterium]